MRSKLLVWQDPARAFEIWAEWADRWEGNTRFRDGNDPTTVADDWQRMRPPFEVGADYIFRQAAAFGFNAAGEEFEALEPAPPAPKFEPIPNEAKEPAPIPLDHPMFYGVFGDIVRFLDPFTEASPVGTLASLLSMYGNYLGQDFYVPIGADRHFATLHCILVGTSALARKGTAANNALKIMSAISPEWARHNVFRSVNSGQGIVQAVNNRDKEARDRGNSAGDLRAMFLIPEFGDVLIKSKQAGVVILTTLRDAWDGGDLDNTSVTRPTRVRGASISLLGMITEDELKDALDLKQLATGSLNRLLLIRVNRSKALKGFPPALPIDLVQDHVSRLLENLGKSRMEGSGLLAMPGTSIPLSLSDDALTLAIEIKARKETTGRTWIETGNQRAFMQTLRVALIYAVADGATTIRPDHLSAAEAFVDYAMAELISFSTGELADPIAQRIITHMRDNPAEAMTRSSISSNVFSGHLPARDLEVAIRLLRKLGLLIEARETTKGRARTVYQLHAK